MRKILDLIFNPVITNTSFDDLRKNIVKLRRSGIYPYTQNLPQSIVFPKDFWSDLVRIYLKTDRDGLERAFSVFWADGEVVFTKINTGSDKMVKSGGTIQVKYSHHPTRKEFAKKELYVDGKVVKKSDVPESKIPSNIDIQYLFNIHTHPKHISENGDRYYNFFSIQDIRSLISSNAIVTGLVTDKLWLLIRTSKSPTLPEHIPEVQITPEYVQEKLHMGLYKADFKKNALRQNLVKTT